MRHQFAGKTSPTAPTAPTGMPPNAVGPEVLTELTEVELVAVAGGINPQPLPPRVEARF